MTSSPKQSALYSILIHAGVIALILLATSSKTLRIDRLLPASLSALKIYLPAAEGLSRGGGGGGKHDLTPASLGNVPRRATRMFVPPTVKPANFSPRLAVDQSILLNADANVPVVNVPQIGDPDGVLGRLSGGRGGPNGVGDGDGAGTGRKTGDGYGLGPGGPGDGEFGEGGSRRSGTLTAPVVLWKVEPAYSEDARRAKLQGTVVLLIEIDARGQAQNIRVVRSLGLGLDEKAIDAVTRWKFRPAFRNGKPVAASATIEVNFRLL